MFCLGAWGWVIDDIWSHLTRLCHLTNMINSIVSPSSARLPTSLALGQPSPALPVILLDHFCPTCGSAKVSAGDTADKTLEAFSPGETRDSRSCQLQLVAAVQPFCSLEKPPSSQCLHGVLGMWETVYKPLQAPLQLLFFPTRNKVNPSCSSLSHTFYGSDTMRQQAISGRVWRKMLILLGREILT